MAEDWTRNEVIAIVSDYYDMLKKELSGIDYVKAQHRRNVVKLLNDRSEGSIEFKHQNISAVLIEMGLPYIPGYKPRGNYQQLLKEEVENYLSLHPELDEVIGNFLNADLKLPQLDAFLNSEVEVPKFEIKVDEPFLSYTGRLERNYYKQELKNKKLGLLGEEFVINYEKQRLINLGMKSYSNKIEHISQTDGDSAGFDILSFSEDGKEKFIEVKTTQMGKDAPFYFTRNEFSFSKSNADKYSLYRLFNFRKDPKFYQLKGSLKETSYNLPTEYLGWPK
ncbi:DUF3883 domain-containing protein [Rhodohalobacter mucosus]|uniref:Protein NO VEIN C-terminal domain-containing protein n=1 Tax=Rhodohalobacter mucosus TaxID=2079485 RepID=A0A316TT47_9BACT|nr:DUF3883 domain-containing protein [Rhodohalobacter mucosus]PWN05454.1 hypothetical protein DDZ15_15430 [Rhodohalobacter mucosus]